jgi:hypothetical protein
MKCRSLRCRLRELWRDNHHLFLLHDHEVHLCLPIFTEPIAPGPAQRKHVDIQLSITILHNQLSVITPLFSDIQTCSDSSHTMLLGSS